jgi:phenylalanyl-tRNA synthetase alpha subunit
MVDNKSKDESNTAGPSSNATHVFDTVKENFVRAVDEMAKVQPQYSQAFSNLQLDYIQTTKNVIQNTISSQRKLVENLNIIPASTPYMEQFTRQSNEITNNTLRAVGVNNQLVINAVDVARENLRIYNRTVDAVTEFSNNVAKVCTAFSAATAQQQQQQQQFAKQ